MINFSLRQLVLNSNFKKYHFLLPKTEVKVLDSEDCIYIKEFGSELRFKFNKLPSTETCYDLHKCCNTLCTKANRYDKLLVNNKDQNCICLNHLARNIVWNIDKEEKHVYIKR